MQPPLLGSQVNPEPQTALFGVCVHLPPEQESVVHAMRSSQSLSAQQALQPTPAQQLPPFTQVPKEQLPPTHLPDWHGSELVQSPSFKHWAVCTQPLLGSHEKPIPQVELLAVFAQVPVVHESLVQSILSSQFAAEQHVPHDAEVPSALGQHVAPAVAP